MQVVETWKSKRFRKFHQYGDEEGTFRDPLEKGGSGGAAKTSTTGDPAGDGEQAHTAELSPAASQLAVGVTVEATETFDRAAAPAAASAPLPAAAAPQKADPALAAAGHSIVRSSADNGEHGSLLPLDDAELQPSAYPAHAMIRPAAADAILDGVPASVKGALTTPPESATVAVKAFQPPPEQAFASATAPALIPQAASPTPVCEVEMVEPKRARTVATSTDDLPVLEQPASSVQSPTNKMNNSSFGDVACKLVGMQILNASLKEELAAAHAASAEQAEHVKALEAAVVRLQDTLDGSQQDSRLLRNRLATLDKALQDKQKQDAGAAVYGRVHLERLASLQARVRELEAQPLVVIDAAAAERSGGQAEAVPVQLVIHVQEVPAPAAAWSSSTQTQAEQRTSATASSPMPVDSVPERAMRPAWAKAPPVLHKTQSLPYSTHRALQPVSTNLAAQHALEVAALEEQLQELRSQCAAHKPNLEGLQQQLDKQQSDVAAARADHAKVQQELGLAQAELQSTKAVSSAEKLHMQAAMDAASAALSAAQLRVQTLEQEAAEQQATIASLQADLQAQHADLGSKLTAAVAQVQEATAQRDRVANDHLAVKAGLASSNVRLWEQTRALERLQSERRSMLEHAFGKPMHDSATQTAADMPGMSPGVVPDAKQNGLGSSLENSAQQQHNKRGTSEDLVVQSVGTQVDMRAQDSQQLQQDVAELRRELAQKDDELAAAAAALVKLQVKQDTAQTTCKQLDQDAASLRNQLEHAKLQSTCAAPAAELGNAVACASQLEHENPALSASMQQQIASFEQQSTEGAALQGELANAVARASQLEHENAALVATTQQHIATLAQHSAEVASLAAELEESQQAKVALASQVKQHHADLDKLQGAYATLRNAHSDAQDLVEQQAAEGVQLNGRTAELEGLRSALQAAHDDVCATSGKQAAELLRLKGRIEELEASHMALQATHRDVCATADSQAAELAELAGLHAELQKAKSLADHQANLAAKASAELAGLQAAHAGVVNELQAVVADRAQVQRAQRDAAQQLEAAQSDAVSQRAELAASEKALSKLQALAAEYAELQSAHSHALGELKAAQANIEGQNAASSLLQQQLEDSSSTLTSTTTDLAARSAELAAATAQRDAKPGLQPSNPAATDSQVQCNLRTAAGMAEAALSAKRKADAAADAPEPATPSTVLRPFPLHHDAGSGTDSSGGDFDWGAGEGGQADSWLKSELYRLACENDMLNERVRAYEREVEDLVAAGNLGHSNPKQKLQYHVRWKEELEAMRKQLTGLLRERFQLEQCVRYLAVKAGLVVEMNVDGSHERAPLERLQPASLVHHYKFAAQHPLTADLLPSTRHLWDDDDGAASVVSMASTASAASSRPSFAPVTPQKPGSHLASPNSKSPSTAGRTYSRTNSTAASHAAADGTIAPQLPSALSKATSQSAQQEGTKSASRGFGRTISAPQAHSSAGAPLTAAALQQFAESGGIASRPAGPGSEAGSLAVPVEGIEAQILARVALICSPNPAKKTKGQALRKGWV